MAAVKSDKQTIARIGKMAESRFESWSAAHGRNCGEQKLLQLRLKDLERERTRSLYNIDVERRYIRKDHNKLLQERRALQNCNVYGEKYDDGGTSVAYVHVQNAKAERESVEARLNVWKSAMAGRCQSAAARLQAPRGSGEGEDGALGIELGTAARGDDGIHRPDDHRRPTTSVTLRNRKEGINQCPLAPPTGQSMLAIDIRKSSLSSAEVAPKTEPSAADASPFPRRPGVVSRRAEMDQLVKRKVARLRALSVVPTDFDLRAKKESAARSGRPQLSMNSFEFHHHDQQLQTQQKKKQGKMLRRMNTCPALNVRQLNNL